MKETSLFRRLFLSILAMLLLLFLLGAFLVIKSTSKEINSDYDAQLIADSHTVWTLVREDLEEGSSLGELHLDFDAPSLNANDRNTLSLYARWRAVRIWKDNQLAAESENLKNVPQVKSKTGFSEQNIGGEKWRIYTEFVPQNKITVEVWENLHNRNHLLISIGKGLAESGILVLPLLVLLVVLTIRHGMGSLLAMAQQVKTRQPEDLSPIEINSVPKEIIPLHNAINMLLERIRHSLAHERQFMDNVAHELRTPLSALRLQGELIAKAPNQKQRQECIDDLIKGIDRATYLFDQILMFSRLSHKSVEMNNFSPISLIQEVIAQRANIALDKKIDISLDAKKEITLNTNPELLQIMLGALLDNAIKYTPARGKINVTLKPNAIIITDTGPGIAKEDREKVFGRFTRGQARSIEGSGLGLSIVKEICTKTNVGIKLSGTKTGKGLVVTLSF